MTISLFPLYNGNMCCHRQFLTNTWQSAKNFHWQFLQTAAFFEHIETKNRHSLKTVPVLLKKIKDLKGYLKGSYHLLISPI